MLWLCTHAITYLNSHRLDVRMHFVKNTEQWSNLDDMFHNNTPSLLNLPIELIYRILDHMQPLDLLLSVREVCSRLNAITDTYYPYQVNFTFLFYSDVHFLRNVAILKYRPRFDSFIGWLHMIIFPEMIFLPYSVSSTIRYSLSIFATNL